ncbi:MAG: hypothetical protein GC149_19715 [Gammaproteobacteria bacterium]|nr:hypothetical protein [Gammaproteobacteria bacterium]
MSQGLIKNYSYFGAGDLFAPGRWLDNLLHPYRHTQTCNYQGKPLLIRWTQRAQQALEGRDIPLLVEMQLYFSCMVKKRVLFHSLHDIEEVDTLTINDNLAIIMRAVQASSCDPEEFARHYPAQRILETPAAKSMQARQLDIDCRHGQWQGAFVI